MKKVEFENIGYFKEYYCNNDFIGSIVTQDADQDFGFMSRVFHVAKSDFKIGKKWIKKGSEYYTVLMPLCGKLK